MQKQKAGAPSLPELYTVLSPDLLQLYNVKDAIVVVIDVLRATSTIATALYNGATAVVPVDDVAKCISLGESMGGITAGERDGRIAEGLAHGNSPFEYPREFIGNKTLILTTTNGTKLLHMALNAGAGHIVTGAFCNCSAVCDYLVAQRKPVLLACAAWKGRVNFEDLLFAGAVASRINRHFYINCDSSKIAQEIYASAGKDLYGFLKQKNASHYQRLSGFGLEKDLQYCLTEDLANVLPFYENERLVIKS
ncbi:MAG: 2-phosphosulfolactate phosphatase [Chitinophagaceae bacterium]|nr:2-phosphosulfolactate phosphatase [Chitinophagaceae bacterium]